MPLPSPQSTALNQSTLRHQNLGLVARSLWGAGGGWSRADLALATGLTRATVSRLVNDLIDARMVVEDEEFTGLRQPGRPATPLRPAKGTIAAMGIELNVDHVGGRVIDLAGTILGEFVVSIPLDLGNPLKVLESLGDSALRLMNQVRSSWPEVELHGMALAIPGLVTDSEIVRLAPNLGWRDIRPADAMQHCLEALAVDLMVENDANLQAYGAARIAPGQLVSDPAFLYVAGDIGVGAAVIEDGEFRRGRHGWAGEMGHVTVEPDGPECGCGSWGCLEQYAGRRAIHEAAGISPQYGSRELLSRLRQGDERAHQAIQRAGWALGIAIADTLNVVDLPYVVLGTTLAEVSEWLTPALRRSMDQRLMWADLLTVGIGPAHDDDLPAATGGAYHILESVISRPPLLVEN